MKNVTADQDMSGVGKHIIKSVRVDQVVLGERVLTLV